MVATTQSPARPVLPCAPQTTLSPGECKSWLNIFTCGSPSSPPKRGEKAHLSRQEGNWSFTLVSSSMEFYTRINWRQKFIVQESLYVRCWLLMIKIMMWWSKFSFVYTAQYHKSPWGLYSLFSKTASCPQTLSLNEEKKKSCTKKKKKRSREKNGRSLICWYAVLPGQNTIICCLSMKLIMTHNYVHHQVATSSVWSNYRTSKEGSQLEVQEQQSSSNQPNIVLRLLVHPENRAN